MDGEAARRLSDWGESLSYSCGDMRRSAIRGSCDKLTDAPNIPGPVPCWGTVILIAGRVMVRFTVCHPELGESCSLGVFSAEDVSPELRNSEPFESTRFFDSGQFLGSAQFFASAKFFTSASDGEFRSDCTVAENRVGLRMGELFWCGLGGVMLGLDFDFFEDFSGSAGGSEWYSGGASIGGKWSSDEILERPEFSLTKSFGDGVWGVLRSVSDE